MGIDKNKPRRCSHTWDGSVKRKHLTASRYSAAPSLRILLNKSYTTLFVIPPMIASQLRQVDRGWAGERLLTRADAEQAATQTQITTTGRTTTEATGLINWMSLRSPWYPSLVGVPGSSSEPLMLFMQRLDLEGSNLHRTLNMLACLEEGLAHKVYKVPT